MLISPPINVITIRDVYPGKSASMVSWCRDHIGPSIHAIGGGTWDFKSVLWLDDDNQTRVRLSFEFENAADATMFALTWIH